MLLMYLVYKVVYISKLFLQTLNGKFFCCRREKRRKKGKRMFYDIKIKIEVKDKSDYFLPQTLYFTIYKNPIEKLSNVYLIGFVLDYVQAVELMKFFKSSDSSIYITFSLFEVRKDERNLKKIIKKEIGRNRLVVKNLTTGKYLGHSNERIFINALCVSELSNLFFGSRLRKATYSFENGAEELVKEISEEFLNYSVKVPNPKFDHCLMEDLERKVKEFYYPIYFIQEKPSRYLFYGITVPSNVSLLESLNFVNRKYKLTYYPTVFLKLLTRLTQLHPNVGQFVLKLICRTYY
jgi:hypothetical protein